MSDDFDFENVPAETPLSPEEAIIRRHRREKKDLQGKILSMKKCVNPRDKKKKKDMADEILKLEAELEQRHKLELDTFRPIAHEPKLESVKEEPLSAEIPKLSLEPKLSSTPPSNQDLGGDVTPFTSTPGTPKISRAQKRREKKSTIEKERQKRIEVETEALVENSDWKKEDDELEAILKGLQMEVFDIPADGHCLYAAVSHQLEQHGENSKKVEALRQLTADYLLKNKAEFINYFDETISGSDENFVQYCKEIETTAAWGGQVEVQVLSKILKRPIRVIQADGPPLNFGEEFKGPILTLTYHRHKIQAGEHYNSAVPITAETKF